MQFSRKIDYGLILLEALRPTYRSSEHRSLQEIAKERRLPFAFLGKLASALKRAGFVSSKKGAGGGYRLIRAPSAITLREVIETFGEPPMMKCMHSLHPEKFCALVKRCPTRAKWQEVERDVNSVFERVTIDAL